ncbi:dynein axonemal assembly factor 4-like [Portunus trituberculatus]|uniref:Dyslexia susceptibility 1 candidate protein 1 n=1 Tax=Portunus trituberculatus TaxID=210409 RepID=A0A5B7D3G4_PORTR|nr:dynein axonemal assembly factor 4-like [Portunus trituberculatus]XP_045120062.1 dynein axonemal assembly factor 4-like [Portunus trituberculatus]MPC15464.1 Dyslexia susceptibility 1 candidate protein 1 [Portunus trituberculatus]
MPICVSDYTWRQTLERVTLILNLHHTSPKKVDVVTTSSYLKVSFLPYMCEVFLCHMIKVDQSSACILKGCLELTLMKAVPQMWKEVGLKLNKEEMALKRQEAIKDMEEEEKRKTSKRKEECIKRERFAVSHQIEVDDQTRAERSRMVEKEKTEFFKAGSPHEGNKHLSGTLPIQNMGNGQPENHNKPEAGKLSPEEHNTECLKEDQEGQTLRGRASSTCSEEGTEATQEADYDGDGEDSIYYSSTENLHRMDRGARRDKVEAANRRQKKWNANRKATAREKESKKRSSPTVPPVRCGGTINMTHTQRVFPSPARESTHPEEQQWLEAQSGASPGQQDTGGSSSQPNEEHFKKKAVTLFSSGDYQGCANACTEGLRLNPSSPAFYSNRAAAHLALRNLHHTVKDCSKALELLIPPTQDNSKSRLLCHIRRGTALVHLSLLSEGLADYQAALQLSPENKALRKDAERIQNMLMASTDSNEDSGCEAGGERCRSSSNSP